MNELLQLAIFWLSLLIRLAHSSLGNSKPKQYWQYLTMSILFVLNNFINSLYESVTRTSNKTTKNEHNTSVQPWSLLETVYAACLYWLCQALSYQGWVSGRQSGSEARCSHTAMLARVAVASSLDGATMTDECRYVPVTCRCHRCEPASQVSSSHPSPAARECNPVSDFSISGSGNKKFVIAWSHFRD